MSIASSNEPSRAEITANLALDVFAALPQKCKPRILADGRREWTPMAAVVLDRSREEPLPASENLAQSFKIMSLATGTKSLPVSALPKCNGLVLHDCHAEILALRGLNYWLLQEMEWLLSSEDNMSPWLELKALQGSANELDKTGTDQHLPFKLREGIEVSLFTTEAPCGDASMELLMAATKMTGQDVSPWPTSELPTGHSSLVPDDTTSSLFTTSLPPGRGYFSQLGTLRRKPARADAEISMSKSCTDKLMLKQSTGLAAFLVNLFLQSSEETFLKRLVVYEDQYCEEGYERAFAAQGRLKDVLPSLPEVMSKKMSFLEVMRLPEDFRRFEYEKKAKSSEGCLGRVSNLSALWIAPASFGERRPTVEVLVNGVKQGYKQFDHREGKGSAVCRKNMVDKASLVGRLLQSRGMLCRLSNVITESRSYSDMKELARSEQKRWLKHLILDGLGGWPPKVIEDNFEVDIPTAMLTGC